MLKVNEVQNFDIKFMKPLKSVLFLVSLLGFLLSHTACEDLEKVNENLLPKASGATGELMIFMDTTTRQSSVGKLVDSIFNAPQLGVLQGEKRFRVHYIDPMKINKFLKMHINLIFVTLVNDKSIGNRKLKEFFPAQALQKIKKNPDYFMFTKQDVYAKGQRVLHLFGNNPKDLKRNLREHHQKLLRIFEQTELQRISTRLSKARQTELEAELTKKHQVKMLIPKGYKKAFAEKNFVWYRFPERKIDRNLFIAYQPYRSESQFEPDSILAWRNRITKKHLFADPQYPESFIRTETLEPPVFQQITLNGKYAIEMRGLWRTNAKLLMGGPFIASIFADTKSGRLFYVEGFVYAPGEPKRELIRELNALIHTTKPVGKNH